MKVHEAIEILKEFPSNAELVFIDNEYGPMVVDEFELKRLDTDNYLHNKGIVSEDTEYIVYVI